MVGPAWAEQRIYEVSDPLNPHLLCRISQTTAHLFTGDTFAYLRTVNANETDIVLHSLGSGNESKAGSFPVGTSQGDWRPDGSAMTWTMAGPNDANGIATAQVWLFSNNKSKLLFSYSIPGVDSFGRPGLPPQIDSLSPDGEYVIAGWAILAKGVQTGAPRLFRVSDGAEVALSYTSQPRLTVWARKGHALYIVEADRVQSWTPEMGLTDVPGASPWTMSPNFAPGGQRVAYTSVQQDGGIRVSTYDFASGKAQLIIDKPRSQAVFVKPDWVWYLEEAPCVQAANDPCFDTSTPTGTVLAKNLSTGDGGTVNFAPGEALGQPRNWSVLTPGDLWPLS